MEAVAMSTNNSEATMRIDYSDEWYPDFERTTSLLKQCVNTRGIVRAKTVTFDTVDVTGRADTRLRDGKIPTSRPETAQLSKDLEEHYKKYQIDDWDLFRNNSQYRKMMSDKALAVVNREVDMQIIAELDTTTAEYSGSAITGSAIGDFLGIVKAIRENDVPSGDGKLWGLISPALDMQMMRIDQYVSSRYIDMKPMVDGAKMIGQARSWLGVNWLVHTGLTGFGGALAQGYVFHESAVGHMDDGNPTFMAGTNDEDDYHWCWARVRHCAKVVQPRGVLRFYHNDDAAFA
jgi:hypothetical protein